MDLVRSCKRLHIEDIHSSKDDTDADNWNKVNNLRYYLMKDSKDKMSLFNSIREAAAHKDHKALSELQIEMVNVIGELKDAYNIYKRNILD
jgi:glutamine synthetase